MSFSRAPILRFNDTKPSGNNFPSVKSQHTSRNEKKTIANPRNRPVVGTKKTPSYESGSARSPSARSPWGLPSSLAQPTSLSLPTSPVSTTESSRAAASVAPDSAFPARDLLEPPSPLPPMPARSARTATSGRPAPATTPPPLPPPTPASPHDRLPCSGPLAPPAGARGHSPTPDLPATSPAPLKAGAQSDSGDDAREMVKEADDTSVTSKEEKKTYSNTTSEIKSVKEEDGDNMLINRRRSRSPLRRTVDKRKTVLNQQVQDKKRKFVAARKELPDKEKLLAESSSRQEASRKGPEDKSRDPSSERDCSEGDNLTADVASSGKSTIGSEVWDKKVDEEEIDIIQWADPNKVDVPIDGAGSWMIKRLHDISETYTALLKNLIKKRNHLLELIGGLIAMKRPVVCEELRKQLQDCQKDADQLDLRMESMRKVQTDSISSFGDALSNLAVEHERVKAELIKVLKVKSELESRGGSARLIARATAEEKRLRLQVEKATAQQGALTAELEHERQRNERVDAHAALLGQELQQANVHIQELENKLKEQTAISHKMKEAVRQNQTQIQNMIIERCSMLRDYTEVKNKADTEVNIIVREMETRLEVVNRRLQEEIEMSERLREQNWSFRNLLEDSEARKRAVELFDRAVQASAARRDVGGSASESLISDFEVARSDAGDGPDDSPPFDDANDDEEVPDDNDEAEEEEDNDEGDVGPRGGGGGGSAGGADGGTAADHTTADESEAEPKGGSAAGGRKSVPSSREGRSGRRCSRRGRSGSARSIARPPSVRRARGPAPEREPEPSAESGTETEPESGTLTLTAAPAPEPAPEEAVTVWERVPRPVASGDTEASFGIEDNEDSARAPSSGGGARSGP